MPIFYGFAGGIMTKARMVTNSHGARGAIPSFKSLCKNEPESVTDGVALWFISAYDKARLPISVL